MKKVLSIIIALIMALSVMTTAFALEGDSVLKFNSDGKFRIIHLCDCQDTYPAHTEMFDFIYKVIEDYKPDLVVLGGDNTVGPQETKEQAVEELVKPFVETGTYFTMVFGNHDHQQGLTNRELFDLYVKYGGRYFLGTDEVDTVDNAPHPKSGTHYLPIYSSKDSSKVAYGLSMTNTAKSSATAVLSPIR